MRNANSNLAVIALILTTTVSCAATPEHSQGGMKDAQIIAPAFDPSFKAQRLATRGAHFSWIAARSIYENPVNRPVSHMSSLASLALKSTGGMLRRVVISAAQLPALSGEIPPVSGAEPMNLQVFEKTLDRITGTRTDAGKIEFLVDGDEYFCRLTDAIESAEESVDIRTYIFDNDDYAIEVADRLRKRSEDVRVRIMFDGLGNMIATHTDSDDVPLDHKVPLSISAYLEKNSDVKVRSTTNPWFTSDHTKTTIIDKKIAYVGGMNIGREYRYDWHDLMMEVTGPVVNTLQFESDKAWARASFLGDLANFVAFAKGKPRKADTDGYPVRILRTKSFDSDIHKAQIAAIQSAQNYIIIENAYFSDDRTIYELAKARRRGVDVRVIIPDRGNHGALNASNKVTINILLEHGIRVYRYPGMSHVKAAIYDGWASVGSANFDKLSLKVNKELNLATSHEPTVRALLDQVFIPDLKRSKEVYQPSEVTLGTKLAEIAVDELL